MLKLLLINISFNSVSSGFDYRAVYENLENIVKSKLDNNTYAGGESTVILIIPNTTPTDDQKSFLESKRQTYRSILPGIIW